MVTIENCRLAVSDADLAKFLGPRLAKKGIRHLDLKFNPGVIHAQAEYPLNRFGFGDIRVRLLLSVVAFDAAGQVVDLRISDFDLSEGGDPGLMGKVLGLTMNMAKKITGGELVKKGLEFMRGRLSFLDVDAPGLKLRVKIATLATILKPYVNNLKPDDILVEEGRLILVQGSPRADA